MWPDKKEGDWPFFPAILQDIILLSLNKEHQKKKVLISLIFSDILLTAHFLSPTPLTCPFHFLLSLVYLPWILNHGIHILRAVFPLNILQLQLLGCLSSDFNLFERFIKATAQIFFSLIYYVNSDFSSFMKLSIQLDCIQCIYLLMQHRALYC